MKKLFLIVLLFTSAYCDNLFHNTLTNQWIGVQSARCSAKTNLKIDASKVAKWESGNYFINKNGICFEIKKILHGDEKIINSDKTWSLAHYENGIILGWYKVFYANNRLKNETFFNNGIKEGKYREFYENGILKTEKTYENGLLNGQTVDYEFNGRPKKINFYKDNQKHGIERIYNAQGRPTQEFEYRDNLKLALNKKFFYDSDGNFAYTASYNGNVKHGSWLYYDKQGALYKEIVYNNNAQVNSKNHIASVEQSDKKEIKVKSNINQASIKKLTNANLSLQKTKKEEKQINKPLQKQQLVLIGSSLTNSITKYSETLLLSNLAIFYNTIQDRWFVATTKNHLSIKDDATKSKKVSSGMKIQNTNKSIDALVDKKIAVSIEKTDLSLEAKNGIINGWLKVYDDNSKCKTNIYFSNGKKQGVVKEVSQNGTLTKKWFYDNDKISGVAAFYYDNGLPQAMINFKNSLPHDKATFYDTKGNIIGTLSYKNGVLQ